MAHVAGTLEQWNSAKGCGWIIGGPDGQRYFAHKSEFVELFADGAEPPLGCPVSFVVGRDARSGKERAQGIHVTRRSYEGGNKTGNYGKAPPMLMDYGAYGAVDPVAAAYAAGYAAAYGGAPPAYNAASAYAAGYNAPPSRGAPPGYGGGAPPPLPMPRGGSGGARGAGAASYELQGALVEWRPEKACGWIESPRLPGKRLFAHKSEFVEAFADGADPAVGTQVRFSVGQDHKSGKERAVAIRLGTGSGQGGKGRARALAGTLTEWSAAKGCGWIESKGVSGSRLFAHKSEFADAFEDGMEPPVGTVVLFNIGKDSRSGKDRAVDIRVAPEGEEDGARLMGVLSDWNASKACGWIECPSNPDIGKLFAHKSEFAQAFDDNTAPEVGSEVSFILGADAKSGKERAVDIQFIHGLGEKRAHGGVNGGNAPKQQRVR